MSWPHTLGSNGTPSVDQIIRRLAYHIHRRTLDPDVAEHVLKVVNVTRKTLARYCSHRPPQERGVNDLHAGGPRRLDLYYEICVALGENPGKVLWAATVAGDYDSMLAVLKAELHLKQTLVISGSLGLPNTATTLLVSNAEASSANGPDPDPVASCAGL
jgi:hypothetical protein